MLNMFSRNREIIQKERFSVEKKKKTARHDNVIANELGAQ